ncbi:MAG: hypothetical protein IJJ06_01455 [Mogibacterium sp.]|nr:hypothetical protein [Mogibacterium sp.]
MARNTNRMAMKRREEAGEVVRPDTIVVASGKYGSCVQYAKWLISGLGADAIEYSRQQLGYVSLYKNVIYVGAIRDAEISNVNIMWQNYGNFGLEGRKIIVCGVGLGDPENVDYREKIMKRSSSLPEYCSFYILPGKIDKDRLKRLDKPQFDKFLLDAERIYGAEQAQLIRERAERDYNGIDYNALKPVIDEILATRQ